VGEGVGYKIILKCSNETFVIDLGRYLDKAEYEWSTKINVYINITCGWSRGYHCDSPEF
jgi:hypothetical protein